MSEKGEGGGSRKGGRFRDRKKGRDREGEGGIRQGEDGLKIQAEGKGREEEVVDIKQNGLNMGMEEGGEYRAGWIYHGFSAL